jgi:hypothetical protein
MAKRPTSKKVPKVMTLIGGIGGPITPAISPGSLAVQRPVPFVPPRGKKGRKGRK